MEFIDITPAKLYANATHCPDEHGARENTSSFFTI
jgi:hypothetical protein